MWGREGGLFRLPPVEVEKRKIVQHSGERLISGTAHDAHDWLFTGPPLRVCRSGNLKHERERARAR